MGGREGLGGENEGGAQRTMEGQERNRWKGFCLEIASVEVGKPDLLILGVHLPLPPLD